MDTIGNHGVIHQVNAAEANALNLRTLKERK